MPKRFRSDDALSRAGMYIMCAGFIALLFLTFGALREPYPPGSEWVAVHWREYTAAVLMVFCGMWFWKP